MYLELRSWCFEFLSTFEGFVAHFGVSTTLFNFLVFQLFREIFWCADHFFTSEGVLTYFSVPTLLLKCFGVSTAP